ncbi:MAG: hypothetical protein JJU36_09200 [Phycisphaeraceae bacterium]|nr:hypothetical protein [Phycisphaeraceae bacterium]
MAISDNELDAESALNQPELAHLEPEGLRARVADHQAVRSWAKKALIRTSGPSESLRTSIAQLLSESSPHTTTREPSSTRPALVAAALNEPQSDRNDTTRYTRPTWWWRWSPALAAAVLLMLTLSIAFNASSSRVVGSETWAAMGVDQPPEWLSAGDFNRFSRRHVRSSRGVETLDQTERFSESDAISLGQVASFLQVSRVPDSLDFSPQGFVLSEAGFCRIPGRDSVHLVYRHEADERRADSFSIWVIRADGQWRERVIDRDFVTIDGRNVPHPMNVWREGDLVFFMVADCSDAILMPMLKLRPPKPRADR